MKGTYFVEVGKFETKELVLPPLGEKDILVKNAACGVCGTDVHIYHGNPGSAETVPPVVLGHEYSGVVEQVGGAVTHIRPGDHVTIDPNIYCGTCQYCRMGKKQLCEAMEAVGVTRDGGFAEYSVVPAAQALVLDPSLDLEAGAMCEPLACCIHGIDLAGIRAGDTVLVIGGGAIGLLMVQLAKLSGAAKVLLSEPVEARRNIALQIGADAAFDPMAESPAKVVERYSARGADVVIECVGITAATQQAVDAAAKGATILLFSVPSVDATFPLPLHSFFQKELTIKSSFVNPDTHSRAVELLNTGKVDIKPLITHRFPLEGVEAAIHKQMSSDSIKVLVVPGAGA